ncbi:MarR family winged helix-turn-helix transcriptional regulator [Psychrosphaera sp. F3M07]|uniref:MarR family winged helix-turn-helix transcriptional regulator n=1 Tax=Psychrosphaera aquimarina TaxID=2044854 RepID=A0ABU3QYQ7_9GAMM|nr:MULTISPECIES: MarR family winged helix-turn-helix transcriptional regulator [Psychrosphaera]MBU2918300.1 MarR family winged helix-turn-helix transcriptional regulator [Psychrosphaera sp. F3M07]MDU0112347.1 MarR family winged helix-turn-helix transcriptional regulator [Psychrosphaera aquimarina]
MEYPQLKLDNQICHRLYMASNRIIRNYRDPLIQLDLTYPQYIVMMALWEKDGITIADLLEKTAIDGGAMTQILKKMTDKSLLSIVKDENDKRKRIIKLETHGSELRHQAAAIPDKIRCSFSHMTDQEAQQLIALLDKVNQEP